MRASVRAARCSAVTMLVGLSIVSSSCGRRIDHSTATAVPVVRVQRFADSASGLQAQIGEILDAARSRDETALRTAIAALSVPDVDQWLATHFDSRLLPQLAEDYAKAFSGYQSHVTWAMENFAKFDDFSLRVEPSEMPEPLADSGFESLLPRPLEPVKVENFRLTSTPSNPRHGPPSWVSSFIFVDGRFRFVGGTYPFWAEKLSALRGPMSLTPASIHGMTVQGIASEKELSVPGIAAIVQLKVDIARDGRARDIKVLSGEDPYIEDAKDYVEAADFGALPNTPQFANATREWEIAVAFFKPKN